MSALMTGRFQKQRWSLVRLAIHGLKPGETMRRPMVDYNSCHASVCRFNDAYSGRRIWKMSRRNGTITITRTK